VSSTNTNELERTLLRSGDDLYRLALLLSTDEAGASQALIKATRRLALSGTAAEQPALIAALLQSLPPERKYVRQRRLPAWARPRAAANARAELLAALAGLPRAQRFALGLTMLRSFESTQTVALFGDEGRGAPGAIEESSSAGAGEQAEAAPIRTMVRDALLALAPIAIPTVSPTLLDSANAPEDCRPTRTALALNDPALHHDAALRGHLALCSACRAAEHAWHSLSIAVEEALRGALRDTRLPPALAEQLQVAMRPAPATGWAMLVSPRVRLALVALPVLALVAFLVWPRGVPPAPTASAPPLAQAPEARALVERAQAQLYLPSAGQGMWHGRYELQWAFADDSTALLAGDVWLDSASGRHRIQLVHHSGGGPYEFELADGIGSASYAVSNIYQPSLYPLSYNLLNRVKVTATPEQQDRMLAARFESGAWGIASNYLRQAKQAELRTWGRQRANDGALLNLVSFAGISPLALPADAPNATTSRVTVLLAIDEASGRLREVRELIGPTGSEQTTRITWRQVSEERIESDQAIRHVFDPLEAWNGVGSFTAIGNLLDPALPLIRPEALTALVSSYDLGWTGLLMPNSAPPGTSAAFLLNHDLSAPMGTNQLDASARLTFVYLAPGRRLEISTGPGATPSLVGGEIVLLDQRQILVRPSTSQGYQAQIDHNLGNTLGSATYTTQVAAFGYSRAELLEALHTIGTPTLASYISQARLFADPGQHDPAAFDALLTALTRPSAAAPRHFVERVFKRQDQQPDRLRDPYHRPRYSGWPEQVIQDNWVRGEDNSRTAERTATTKGEDGTIYGRQYLGPDRVWYYDALASRVEFYSGASIGPGQRVNEDQPLLMRLIACGGGTLQTGADGMRTIILTEQNWRNGGSCMHPEYAQFFNAQTSNDLNSDRNQTPFLADRTEAELTTLVALDANGRDVKIETWAGQPETGTLLQSWELLSDETLPPARVPDATFDSAVPAALQRWSFNQDAYARPAPASVTITQALDLAQTPLFELSTTSAVSGTNAITSTSQLTLTSTARPTQPFLNSIIAGPPPDAIGARGSIDDQNVFEQALRDGYAVRFSYTLTADDGSTETANIYQWSAQTLGAYLRASAEWQISEAMTLEIGGKQISGWHVVERGSDVEWLLFELDGTLIAAESPSFALVGALAQLQPVTR
jgi:hypothetical protein